jgi:predicted phage terminase large subunit-like protein
VDPDPFVDGLHVEAIALHLEAVERGEIRNLIINIPPRHSKSMIVGVMWPCWVWITRPETRWLFSSYAANLSIRDSVKCRRLMLSPWYRARWGDRFALASDQNVKIRFDNDRGGYRYATSVDGATTGDGGDRIVVDDPHNVQQAQSDVQRRTALDWWDGAMSSRGNNPKTVARVVVMQRVHEEDLTGHLLAQGGYEHLCIPAEYEAEHPFRRVTSIGWQDPRRTEGELLTPERFGPAEIKELHLRLGSLRAIGQLQQRPAPKDGAFFKEAWFAKKLPAAPREAERVRYWDHAASEDSGDFTVGLLMAKAEGLYIVEDVVRGQWSPGARDAMILDTAREDARRYGNEVLQWMQQEPGSGGKDQAENFVRMLAGYPAYSEPASGSKEVRANPFAAQAEGGNVRIVEGDWNRAFVQELVSFPVGKNDDQVDCGAGAFNRLSAGATLVIY